MNAKNAIRLAPKIPYHAAPSPGEGITLGISVSKAGFATNPAPTMTRRPTISKSDTRNPECGL